jgi:ubiquinone biosynthesis UbiH/UbiF/VisC/COQ6 family hydroxylase
MQTHGSWYRIDPEQISPIQKAEVYDGDSPYTLAFDTPRDDTDALGFLVSNFRIRQAIFEEYSTLENATLLDERQVLGVSTTDQGATLTLDGDEQLSADLVIAADTRFSNSRRQMGISSYSNDFGRSAVLAWMDHAESHQHTAFECFQYGRTMAILPLAGNRSSVVITLPSREVDKWLAMDEEQFAQEVENGLNQRLGKMTQASERFTYPLVGVHANRFYTTRFALIGDAAVGMHPVTAHGFNLGLSGQDLLSSGIIKAREQGLDFWRDDVLRKYQQQHMLSTRPLYHGTNTVVSLFTNDSFPATLLRKAVLRLSDNLPPVKWAIRQKLMTKGHIKLGLPPLF